MNCSNDTTPGIYITPHSTNNRRHSDSFYSKKQELGSVTNALVWIAKRLMRALRNTMNSQNYLGLISDESYWWKRCISEEWEGSQRGVTCTHLLYSLQIDQACCGKLCSISPLSFIWSNKYMQKISALLNATSYKHRYTYLYCCGCLLCATE